MPKITSSILLSQVGDPPDVAEADGVPDGGQDERDLRIPEIKCLENCQGKSFTAGRRTGVYVQCMVTRLPRGRQTSPVFYRAYQREEYILNY